MTDESNGILASIGGAAIGSGSQSLPRPGPDQPTERTAVVDAGHKGLVRIKYQLKRHNHGKSVTWYWLASHAEPVEPGAQHDPPVV